MWSLHMKGVQMVANDNCFGVIVPASGRLLNLDCITGHHSFLVSCSFTKHAYKNDVWLLPKPLVEKVVALHLLALGAVVSLIASLCR